MNKEKICLFLLSFVCSFAFISNVNAGVCDGYPLESGTCKPFSVTISNSYVGQRYGSYFMRPGYVARTNVGEGTAFCIDPGLAIPTVDLGFIREIDNTANDTNIRTYDDRVYSIYQYFYRTLVEQYNNTGSLTNDFVNTNRAYFQNAIRVLTYKHGIDYLESSESKYDVDAKNYKECAVLIDSSLGSSSKNVNDCFGSSGNLDAIKSYYNSSKFWTNPLKIVNEAKIVNNSDGSKIYRYEFNITFTDGINNFFDGKYSNGIAFNDLNLRSAYFWMKDLRVNGISCNSSNCSNYSGESWITNDTDEQFIVELTEEQYQQFLNSSTDKSVSVTMDYSYRHPLNIENLYTARYDLKNSYQRMLVIQDYTHNDTSTIGKEPETTKCSHTTSGFINASGLKLTNLSHYIASCGCNSVNKSLLEDGDLTNYKRVCSNTILEESYSGSISNCSDSNHYDNVLDDNDADTNYDSYTLGYKKKTKINDYCTETCNETININDLKGKYTTKAGMYFEFNKYPSLVANKSCSVEIDYSSWVDDYNANLDELVSAYNEWKEAVEGEKTTSYREVDCDWDSEIGEYTDEYYVYSFTYNKIVRSGTQLSETSQLVSTSTSCGEPIIDWDADGKLKKFQNLSTKADAIVSLKSDLKACNSQLFGTTNQNFYDFNQDLNYYYYQTYSKGNQLVKNDARSSLGGINDSSFDVTQTINGTSNEGENGSNVNYSTLTESGISNETIFTYNTDIEREVTYNVKYNNPEYKKYAEVFTGKIVSKNTSTGKYIELGYGYDTDVSAIAKSDNENYYSFTKLGASDNKIFIKFKNGTEIKRACTYEITNDIIETYGCSGEDCGKLDIVYRVVDPENVDPNNRLGTDEGFKNWDTVKGETVLADIENADTFNPENLEYSFTLDSATIKKIREYNSNCDVKGECDPIGYSNTNSSYSLLTCNDLGNECTSKFIDTALKDSTVFGDSFATNINGRNKWKYLDYNEKNGYYINEFKKDEASYSTLIDRLKTGGEKVLP